MGRWVPAGRGAATAAPALSRAVGSFPPSSGPGFGAQPQTGSWGPWSTAQPSTSRCSHPLPPTQDVACIPISCMCVAGGYLRNPLEFSSSPPSSSQGPRNHEVIAVVPARPQRRRHCHPPADSPLPPGGQRGREAQLHLLPTPQGSRISGRGRDQVTQGWMPGSQRGAGGAHRRRAWLPHARQGGQRLEGLGLCLNTGPQPCPRLTSHVTRRWPHVEGERHTGLCPGMSATGRFRGSEPSGGRGPLGPVWGEPQSPHRARERLSRRVLGRQGLAWTSAHPFSLCYHRGLLPRVRVEAPGGGPGGARVPVHSWAEP